MSHSKFCAYSVHIDACSYIVNNYCLLQYGMFFLLGMLVVGLLENKTNTYSAAEQESKTFIFSFFISKSKHIIAECYLTAYS